MSQLKKALKKARDEGKVQSWDPESSPRIATSATPQGTTVDISKVPTSGDRDIATPVYSKTRKISIDFDKLIENKVFAIVENDEVSDQYKLLRTMVLNKTRPLGHTTIAVSSFSEGDGKTLTAVNLAVILAKESRQNVLLVDMDLRRPSVHKLLGIDQLQGLREYFTDGIPISELLIYPGIERLTVLPAGGRMNNSTEILGSHRTEVLIEELKQRYPDRYVIFDAPALNTCSDPIILSSYTDAILLVARSGKTTAKAISSSMDLVNGKNVLGIVLNDSDIRKGWAY